METQMKPVQCRRIGGLLRVLAVTALVPLGCGGADDDLPREPISGTVTFDGKPLKNGLIHFVPTTQKEAIASGGIITDGQFKVIEKEGPVPGKYSVMIFARDENPQPQPGPDPAVNEMPGEIKAPRPKSNVGLIPLRYNLNTELSAEVKPDGPNAFAFVLEKK
jgi:hypothetical protein